MFVQRGVHRSFLDTRVNVANYGFTITRANSMYLIAGRNGTQVYAALPGARVTIVKVRHVTPAFTRMSMLVAVLTHDTINTHLAKCGA